MLEFKVIRLVQALLGSELSTVEKYLTAPHVAANKECVQLFVQLCKFHPEMISPKLTKERLFSKVFGMQHYNDGKMRKLMTQLTQAIEQYLMESELKKSEELRAKLLAQALSERNNYKLFSEVVVSRLKVLDSGVGRGRDYFRESFELSNVIYFHPGSVRMSKKDEFLKRAVDDFERYFTLVMLQIEANTVVGTRMVSAKDKEGFYLDEVMRLSELPNFSNNNATRLFHQLIPLLKGKKSEDLEKLRFAAFETFPQLNQFEMDFAINLLRNYAIPFANKGSMEHARFVFDLYKLELNRGFFANIISPSAYINIVSVGLGVDEFEWVGNFIENYAKFLPEDEKENASYYCKGLWYYRQGVKNNDIEAFYNAIQNLNLIPTRSGVNYELRLRSTLLRVQFELLERGKEQVDELLNHVRNFERHIRGNIYYSEPIKESYLNFLKYYKILARDADTRLNNPKAASKILQKLTKDETIISFKPWLLEKVIGLINND